MGYTTSVPTVHFSVGIAHLVWDEHVDGQAPQGQWITASNQWTIDEENRQLTSDTLLYSILDQMRTQTRRANLKIEEPDSQGQISTPPQPQPKAQKSSKSDSKKRAAEESLNNGRPKRERSSADKIQAGLESLSARADVSNELRREALSARVKLIDHTVKTSVTSLTPHEQAFEMLMTQYKEQVDGLSDQHFNALPLFLEQPIRQGNMLSTLGTTKGKHFCMLPPGPRRDAYVTNLLGEGIMAFVAEANAVVPDIHDIGFLYGS